MSPSQHTDARQFRVVEYSENGDKSYLYDVTQKPSGFDFRFSPSVGLALPLNFGMASWVCHRLDKSGVVARLEQIPDEQVSRLALPAH